MRPISVGVEVEANYPVLSSSNIPASEFQCLLASLDASAPAARNGWNPSSYYTVPGGAALRAWEAVTGPRNVSGAFNAWWNQVAPEEFKIPIGVDKSQDGSCGLECKFDGPKSKTEALDILDRWMAWYRKSNVNSFNGAGTHIHLGVIDWLHAEVGTVTSPEGQHANSILFGAMISREQALMGLMPSWRRASNYCSGHFAPYNGAMPLWRAQALPERMSAQQLANCLLSARAAGYPSQSMGFGGSAIVAQRHLPTFEFRLFPATNNSTAAKGYVELVTALWDELSSRFMKAASLSQAIKDMIVAPFEYKTSDLKAEFSSNKPLLRFMQQLESVQGDPQRVSSDEFIQTIPTTA